MSGTTLAAALCLVLVIEGLLLFAAPGGWKRLVEQARHLDEGSLRMVGLGMIVVGLIALRWVADGSGLKEIGIPIGVCWLRATR